MNPSSLLLGILAQAEAVAPVSPAPAEAATNWQGWLVALAVIVVPTLLAWLLARAARAGEMWGRIATVLVALAAGSMVCWLGWPPRLGIDLKGGLILVYEVAAGKQAEARVEDCIAELERLVASQDGAAGKLERGPGRRVTLRLPTTDRAARDALLAGLARASFDGVEMREVSKDDGADALVVAYEITGKAEKPDMDKLVAAVSRRVNPGGQKEVTVRQFGLDQIEVIMPDVEQEEVDQVKRIVSSAGVLEFRILANRADTRPEHRTAITLAEASRASTVRQDGVAIARWVRLDPDRLQEDPQMVLRTAADGAREVLVVLDRFNVTGADLARVSPDLDEMLAPSVSFQLNARGARKFKQLTGKNLPDAASGLPSRLGIVLDDVLQSAPAIRSLIESDGQITGQFDQREVDFLVEVLNAGSLPAALGSEPISEQRISAQLGEDTIASARLAMIIATALVLAFMLFYYNFAGLVADLAVVLNVILVLAVMILFKVAFTLAGLAGLVLSVGMAVDANVLIYERMREELDRGASVRMAIRNGFQRAFATIVDSNLTTLITAAVLFAIGTDQIKGFAITLFFGLALNLFTAVFCSRVVFDLAEKMRLLPRLGMRRLLTRTDIRFVRWSRVAAIASIALIAAGAVASARRGKELFDIDFTGGTSLQVEFAPGEQMPLAEIRRVVGGLFESATVSEVAATGTAAGRIVKIDTGEADLDAVKRAIARGFAGRLATVGLSVGEITTAAPAAGATAAVGTTVVPITLERPLSRSRLLGILRSAAAAANHADAEFDLQAEDAAGDDAERRIWALTTSLAPDAARGMLTAIADEPLYRSDNAIGGKVAGNTQLKAVYALLASLVMIVIYIWIRFQNMAFGVAAVVALAHDVAVAVACLALSRFLAPFMGWAQVEPFRISLDVVAALLTIVGFSINDTIVIFDRLREMRGKARFVTADMIDRAVNQTLSRTILTSGTALLAVLMLYAVGGSGIHAFAFTMLVGVVAGTYSTVYIAAPLVLRLQHVFGERPAAAGVPQPA